MPSFNQQDNELKEFTIVTSGQHPTAHYSSIISSNRERSSLILSIDFHPPPTSKAYCCFGGPSGEDNGSPSGKVNAGTRVTLDGAQSHDWNGDPVKSYSWSQVSVFCDSCPKPLITLDNPNIARPSFIAPSVKQGTILAFRLVVTDGFKNKGSSEVELAVARDTSSPITHLVPIIVVILAMVVGGVIVYKKTKA